MISNILFFVCYSIQLIGWNNFEGTTFEWKYIESEGAEIQIPTFPTKVKMLEGKEIELSGYFLPLDIGNKNIVISENPYASCFFCGGNVGAETVAEIQFKGPAPRFKLDEIVHVKGRLKLNERDLDHLTFILSDAVIQRK